MSIKSLLQNILLAWIKYLIEVIKLTMARLGYLDKADIIPSTISLNNFSAFQQAIFTQHNIIRTNIEQFS